MAFEATLAFDANIAVAALRGSATSAAALMCTRFTWITTDHVAQEMQDQGVRFTGQVIPVTSIDADIQTAGAVNQGHKQASWADLSLIQLGRNHPGLDGIMTRDRDFETIHAASLVPSTVKFWRPRKFYTSKRLFQWDFNDSRQVIIHPEPGMRDAVPLAPQSTVPNRDDPVFVRRNQANTNRARRNK